MVLFSRTCNILHNSYIIYYLNYELWAVFFYYEYFFFLTVVPYFCTLQYKVCTPKTESDPKIFHQTDGSTSYQILLDCVKNCALTIGSNQEFKVIYLGTRVPSPLVHNHESTSCIKSLETTESALTRCQRHKLGHYCKLLTKSVINTNLELLVFDLCLI